MQVLDLSAVPYSIGLVNMLMRMSSLRELHLPWAHRYSLPHLYQLLYPLPHLQLLEVHQVRSRVACIGVHRCA